MNHTTPCTSGLLAGKTAVITGGTHGIGLAIARRFEAEGASVITIDLNQPCTIQTDLSDPDAIEKAAAAILEITEHVDILVNNAPPLFKGIHDCSYSEFMQALAVGSGAPFYLTKLLLPAFSAHASVLNLSSTREFMSQPESESYSAAKGAIGSLTHAMAISLGPQIRVNAIAPGWIETGSASHSLADDLQQPAGRVGTPDDIAALALFLSSSQAGFITGQTITADGGMSRLMIYDGEHGWRYEPSEGQNSGLNPEKQ